MSLTVEDGTGLADAESFLSVADAQAYWTAHGHSYAGKTDTEIEQALRRATQYITGRYRGRWPGTALNGRDQALPWPREDATDIDGEEIASDELPQELLDALAEAAIRELNDPGSLTPDSTETDRVKREKVGPLEVEYAGGTTADVRPTVTLIDELLAPILSVPDLGSTTFLQRA